MAGGRPPSMPDTFLSGKSFSARSCAISGVTFSGTFWYKLEVPSVKVTVILRGGIFFYQFFTVWPVTVLAGALDVSAGGLDPVNLAAWASLGSSALY